MKIALCVIAGDDCFEENIERMLDSVKGKVDDVFISFNGGGAEMMTALDRSIEERGFGGAVGFHAWTEDFSAARNHSFSLAEGADWIVYLDCDDVVPPDTDFRKAIEEAEEQRAHQVYMRYDYKFDESGEVLWHHMVPRAFRADMNWMWIWPVHENCVGPSGVRSVFSEMSISHFRGDEEPKRERNKQIVAHWYRTDPGDPRAVQMMGHEGFAEAEETRDKKLAKEVINIYREFINLIDTDDDDSYIANIQVGRLFRIAEQPSDALNTFLQGIKLRPEWPTAYCEIAETYVIHQHNELAIQWARLARKAGVRGVKTFAPIEEADYEYRPLMIEASALMSEGKFDEARDIYRGILAKKMDPIAKSMFNQAVDMQKKKDADTHDPDSIRKGLWGSEPDRSIAFLTADHFENWDGQSLDEKGLGGTETAVIRIAREYRNAGWRVVIFGTPFKEGLDDDGIEWWKTRRWHPDEPFSVFVGVRVPEVFETPMKAEKKYLWLHDVSVGDRRWGVDGQDLFTVPDAIMCPSQWHVDHMRALYGITPDDEEITFAVAPNGVDIDRFVKADDDLSERDLGTYIYASSPDRGLERLLHFWPEIFRMTKEAGREPKLKIYYGWNNIDMIIAAGSPQSPMLAHFKKKIIAMIDQLNDEYGGIEWIGRVNEVTLARSMKTSGFMLYPGNFCVAGDTPIDCPRDHERFPDGIPISILEPGRLIWTINEATQKFELKPVKRVWKSKTNAPILKLTLDSGKVIRATADHRFMRRDGSWSELRDLKPGDSLMPLYRDAEPMIKLDPNKRAGWSTEYRDVAAHLFGDRKGRHTHHVDERHYNNDPENLQDLSPADHFSLTHKGKKHGSSTRAAMSAAQQARFAVMSDEEKLAMSQRMNRSQWDGLSEFERKVQWHRTHPNHPGNEDCEVCSMVVSNPFFNHKVLSIEPDGFEDVWDMEVEGNHNFVANGVVLHNCETFGIVFQQSLLAGCLPITCSLGALPELLPGELVVSGADPDSEIFKDLFLYRLNELMQIEDDWRKDISNYPIVKRKSLSWGDVFDYVWGSITSDMVVG